MNTIWTILLFFSLIFVTFNSPSSLLSIVIDGASMAVDTSVSLLTVYCFWNGFFAVLENSQLTTLIANAFSKPIKWLFGNVSQKAVAYLSLNVSANLIGVSNAATPSAIRAIDEMEGNNTALSRAGAMLFVINATSIQLLPSTVMGLRASYGSVAPHDIILPTLISTVATTALGIFLINLVYGRRQK